MKIKRSVLQILRSILIQLALLFASSTLGQNIDTSRIHQQTQSNITTVYIDSLNKLAFSIFRTDPAETRRIALENLSLAQSINYRTGEGKAYNYIAMSYHISSNYDTSYVYYQKALSLFESENDTLNTAKIYNNLALLFSHREYYNLALDYNFKSLSMAEKMNDTVGRFHSYNNIGITYEKLGEYDKAVNSYKEGLKVLKSGNIFNDLYYYALGNMGIINLLTNQIDSAKYQIMLSLDYFLNTENNYGISQSYSYLAECEIKSDHYAEAESYLLKSNRYAEKTNDKKLMANNQLLEAHLLFDQDQLNLARQKYLSVISLAKSGKYAAMEISAYERISKIDSIHHNFKNALQYYRAGIQLRDSINSMKIQNQIAELNIRYETLQKDKEIGLLKTNTEMQELKIKKQQTQSQLLLLVLLSALSAVIIGFIGHFKIRKKNQLLSFQNEEIARKNKELLYHQEKLEDIVAERTSELTRAKLKAEESDRLKSAFLATMSHELRTPLNAIIGFSQVMDENSSMEEILRFNKNINTSGIHLLDIVENIFDITMIEAGQINLKIGGVKLESLLNEIHEIILIEQQKSGKINIQIEKTISEECKNLVIETDASKLKQILINLLKNAIKFTKKGFIKYGVIAEHDTKPKRLKFYVEDTGIGIPEDKQEIIFEIFRQVDDGYTREYGGTGIGLSIARKLTELFNGKIWVESKVGAGSVFYFTLPLKKSKITDREDSDRSENSDKLKGKTILIVEDDRASFEYLSVVAERLEMKSEWAKDGKIAVEMCHASQSYKLVLMDLNMPVMNGYEATKEIKKIRPELPVIAQTAYAILGDREKAIAAGCDDYIAKPVKQTELKQKLITYIN